MKKTSLSLQFLIPLVLVAIVGAFARIMTSLNHNEHMYIAASVLVARNYVLYKDFAYLQAPYLPLLYGNLYRLLHVSSYYLLIGKLVSFLFVSTSAMTLFLMARRVTSDVVLSLSSVALFLLNMTIVNPATEVSNYIVPVAFSMVSFYILDVSINKNYIKPRGIALAGFFLAIAIGTKLTYATVVIPVFATILLYPRMSEHSAITAKTSVVCVFFPFIAGLAIGLLPVFFYLLSDTESFIFNNLGYHNVNTQWRRITGYPGPMSLFPKILYAHRIFFLADNLILLFGILLGLGFSISRFQTIKQAIKQIPTGAFLALLLFLIAVPTALAPTPSFPQYFAMPVSFLFLLLVYACASKAIGISIRRLLLILVLVSVAYDGPIILGSISRLTSRNGWIGFRIHDVSTNVRNALIDNGVGTDHHYLS